MHHSVTLHDAAWPAFKPTILNQVNKYLCPLQYWYFGIFFRKIMDEYMRLKLYGLTRKVGDQYNERGDKWMHHSVTLHDAARHARTYACVCVSTIHQQLKE